MIKRLLIAISMVLVLGGPAFAGSSRGASYQGYSSGYLPSGFTTVDTRGGLVYNITLNASSANAVLVIYDANALSANGSPASQETPVYEIEVATANDSRSVDMNAAPLQTYSGILASVTNGYGYMNIEK